ncbi:MAG TPA: restriction endonuclease subunit S, partial [Candidatus Limnocylindria bacterium]
MPERLLREGWARVAFGDVVQLSHARSADPAGDGYDRYVGLEHIEPNDLTIRHWGRVADGTTFTNVFRAGQTLFGKRRAYQRKIAVVDFDGVCSGDIYVLETKDTKLLPELLPLLCQSEDFFAHAIGTSAGSLSPRTNWESLAKYEFLLPPLDEQRQIASLIEGARRLEEATGEVVRALAATLNSWLEHELEVHAVKGRARPAADLLARATVGIVVRPASWYVRDGEGIPALRSLNVIPNKVVMKDLVFISREGHAEHKKSRLCPGDVVIVRSGRPGDAAVIPEDAPEMNCIDLIICTPGPELLAQFFCAVLNSSYGRRQFAAGSAGTAQQHFNVEAVRKLLIPVPDLEAQSIFIRQFTKLKDTLDRAETRVQQVR